MKKFILLLLIQIVYFPDVFSQSIFLKVRLFPDQILDTVEIIPLTYDYRMIFNDSTEIPVNSDQDYEFYARNGKLEVVSNGISLGIFSSVQIMNKEEISTFRIKIQKEIDRVYDNNMVITSNEGDLRLINLVELENYVAGVVQAEVAGATNLEKFFEIQAIISRTYALNNIMKHYKEGYNLCDNVHCQVYRGHCNNINVNT